MPLAWTSRDHCSQCPWPHGRSLSTHTSARDSQTHRGKYGSISCGVTAPFSLVLVHTGFCLCPPRVSVSPVLWQFCNQILQSQVPWGYSVHLPDPQVGKSVGPRTFAAAGELFWYDCFPVCESPGRQLYSRANGDLLQKDLCHTLCLPGLLLPEPLSPWQATADSCLCWRPSNTQRQVWFSLWWGSLHLSLGPVVHKVSFVPSKHPWWVWGLILNVIVSFFSSCLGLLLCPWLWGIFF